MACICIQPIIIWVREILQGRYIPKLRYLMKAVSVNPSASIPLICATGNILIWKFKCPRGIEILLLDETEKKHKGKRRTKSNLSSHCWSWDKSPGQSSPKYCKWCNHENAASD